MALFWQRGYEGTSIADLTEAMGAAPPTLYAAFGSKEQLYRDALLHYIDRRGDLLSLLGADTPTYEALEQYLRQSAERFTNPAEPRGCMILTASLHCAAENEAARAIVAELRAKTLELVVARLTRAKEAGELPEDAEALALARFYSAVVQGMSVQAIDGASTAELNRLVDMALAAWPGKRPGP